MLDKRVNNSLYLCLIGGLMCLAQSLITVGLVFGYYYGWWFCPNILISSTLCQSGASLGLKESRIGPLLCIIAGFTGIISIMLIVHFILVYFPFYLFGALFSLFGGINAYLNFKR